MGGLGSSIGIKKARTEDELKAAIEVAAKFDEKIIVENALENFKELNCAAYSDGRNIYVSEVESPVSWHDFLSFDDKYSGGKNGGGKREIPATLRVGRDQAHALSSHHHWLLPQLP